MEITWLDVLVGLVIVASAVYAAWKGLLRETLSIFAWALAAYASLVFGRMLRTPLRDMISAHWLADVVAYGSVFLIVLIPLSFLSFRFSESIQRSPVGPVDRTLGFVFGIGRGLVLVALPYIAFTMLVPIKEQPGWVANAATLPVIQRTSDVLLSLVPGERGGNDRETRHGRHEQAHAHEPGRQQAAEKPPPVKPTPKPPHGQPQHRPRPPCARKNLWRPRPARARQAHRNDGGERAGFGMSARFDQPWDGDKLHEECGVFGVFGHDDAPALTALGLHALQHRGQEAAGIVASDGRQFTAERHTGLVGDVFGKNGHTSSLKGANAIGHVRYSTTGGPGARNVQPMFADLAEGGLALAHNGNLTNANTLRQELVAEGRIFQSTSDTETIIHLTARSHYGNVVEKLIDALKHVEGAYSLVGLTRNRLIGVRDPYGVRPAGAGQAGRRVDPVVRNLRPRYYRRRIRARCRAGRNGGDHQGRRGIAASLRRQAAQILHLRIRLLRASRFDGRGPQRL